MAITNSKLHHQILRHFIDDGHAPSIDQLASQLDESRDAVVTALKALADYHGVVLQPTTSEVWVIHPFSTAPTNFWVESRRGSWWGNCAWCSLGVAALLGEDVTITTTLGGESKQIKLNIVDGRLTNDRFFVHFPIPMAHAWDNVVFTCSNMLVFHSEEAVDNWCARHRMQKGDVQPIANVWNFAQSWYGRHLDEDWKKWTAVEAKALFAKFNLTGPTWDIPVAETRF